MTDARCETGTDWHSDRIIANKIYRSSTGLHVSVPDKLRVISHLTGRLAASRREAAPPIFHFFFTPNPPAVRMVSLLSRLNKNARLIHTITSCPVTGQSGIHRISHMWLNSGDIITLSHRTRRILESELDRPVLQIYPGVPIEMPPATETIRAARHAEGFSEDFMYFLYPGDLHFARVLPFWRSILPDWRTRFPRIRIVMTTRTKHPADTACRDDLTRQDCDSILFRDNVTDMSRLISACDGVLFPVKSLYAKMDIPLVLLESMSRGKPVIMSTTESLRELADFGGVITADPDRPVTFTQAMEKILASPDELKAIGREGAETVRRHFNAEKMARAVETVYQRAVR